MIQILRIEQRVPSLQLFCIFSIHLSRKANGHDFFGFVNNNNDLVNLINLDNLNNLNNFSDLVNIPDLVKIPPKIRFMINSVCSICLGLKKTIKETELKNVHPDDISDYPVLNFRSRRLTKLATRFGHVNCLLFLIDNGFYCDYKECLVSAVHFGHFEIFKTLQNLCKL